MAFEFQYNLESKISHLESISKLRRQNKSEKIHFMHDAIFPQLFIDGFFPFLTPAVICNELLNKNEGLWQLISFG